MSLIALAFAAAMTAQDPGSIPRDCLDDDHTNRCDPEVQARVRALVGLAAIEDEAAAGVEIYRAFFVDGYGRDMPVVSFERRPGEPPKVVVSATEGRNVSAPVLSAVWDRVVSEARFADRTLAFPTSVLTSGADFDAEPLIAERICLHAWVVTVEMANSASPYGDNIPVRRRTEDACNSGLSIRFALNLADLAVASLPACEALDLLYNRNGVTLLESCLTLEGDTLAAASLMNEKHRPPVNHGNGDRLVDWSLWVSSTTTARLDWAGQITQDSNMGDADRQSVAEFLLEQSSNLPHLRVYQNRFVAESAVRARITGEVSYSERPDGGNRRTMVADYDQEWSRDAGSRWSLVSWTVEPFRPLPQAD